jgi:aspartate aminotransferase
MKKSKRVSSVAPSLTLAITAKAKQMKAEGIDVIGFGSGEPDFDTPENIKQAAIKAIQDGFTKYTPASGIIELKKAVAAKLKKDNNLDYEASQVVISCGAKHTIYNIIQAICDEGDEVLIPAPYWLSYPEMVKLASGTPVIMETKEEQEFKINPSILEKYITDKTKVLILNSPSNPTGIVYSQEELQAIADFMEDKDIYVISDEIYEYITYEEKHVSIASLSDKLFEKTIVVNGHSKAYSMTGWRIGYMAGPKAIVAAVSSLQSHSTSNPTSIAQIAALEALNGEMTEVEEMVVEFKKRRDYMVDRLNAMNGITCLKPKGAFYVFPNITGLNKGSSMEISEKLLNEANIAVVPGIAFGNDSHLRLSYATSLDLIEEGMNRLENWING